jgi:hypothetical protein
MPSAPTMQDHSHALAMWDGLDQAHHARTSMNAAQEQEEEEEEESWTTVMTMDGAETRLDHLNVDAMEDGLVMV